MFSVHDQPAGVKSRQGASQMRRLARRAGLSAALGTALLVAIGCKSKGKPFDDVTSRSKQQSTTLAATQPGAAVVQPAEPAAEPVVKETPAGQVVLTPIPTGGTVTVPSSIPPFPNSTIDYRVTPQGALRRDWPVSVAVRPSGDVVAWPLYYHDVANVAKLSDWQASLVESGFFVLDTILLPVDMVITPPWTKVVYSSADDAVWNPNPPADQDGQQQTGGAAQK